MNISTSDDLPESEGGARQPTRADVGRPEPTRVSADFADVYEEHFEFVWRSLRLLGVAPESLDDAVQDAFGVVLRKLPEFEGRSTLRTWIFGIVQNVALNQRRWQRRKSSPLQPLDEALVSAEPSPHARAEARQAADTILRFCAELDAGRRTVFCPRLAALFGGPCSASIASRSEVDQHRNEGA